MACVIGFDTATDDTAVAATRDGVLLFASTVEPAAGRPQHATRLLVEVEQAAAAAGGWDAVQRIAVGTGPGSFTGLRIGLATAKALARSVGVELAAVPTPAALARGAEAEDRQVLAVLDARRGDVFAALYAGATEPVWDPFVARPEELAGRIADLAEPPVAVGAGAVRFRRDLQKGGAVIPGDADPAHWISARQTCEIGALGDAAAPESVLPIYLRPPDAERWRERDSTDN